MKPHPVAFDTLLGILGVAPEEAVFVGDRHLDDIDGANALGMRTVHLQNGATPPGHSEPDAVIHELGELVPLVDGWL